MNDENIIMEQFSSSIATITGVIYDEEWSATHKPTGCVGQGETRALALQELREKLVSRAERERSS